MRPTLQSTLLFLFCSLLLQHTVLAQYEENERIYKKWRFEGMMGYARPSGPGNKAGVLLSFEPKYNVTNQLSVGLRNELTAMARGYVDVNGNSFSGKAGAGLSFFVTGDYFFTNSLVRPFAGAGAGIYNLFQAEVNTSGNQVVNLPAVTKPGLMLRTGVDLWHLRAAIEYNMVGKTGAVNNNYLGLKIGIVIGGGPNRSEEY